MLQIEKIKIALESETPFYLYNLRLLNETLELVKRESEKHNFLIHYAIKANADDKVLNMISQYGLGSDCVSGNEILLSVKHNFDSEKIVFAGVGKTDKDIEIGLQNNIFCFNCESFQEIEVINEIAKNYNQLASIAIRINPNIQANTHHYITTGLEENKFGIHIWEVDEVLELIRKLNNVKLIGFHVHIGSQITDLNVFKGLCLRINEIQDVFENKNMDIQHVNVGGGLGVNYVNPDDSIPNFKDFFSLFNEFLILRKKQRVHFELGRSIVAQCGSLISKVLYIKKGVKTNFAIIDAGMTELLRPALYQQFHKIDVLKSSGKHKFVYDVVGPICESSDCFGKSIEFNELSRSDLLEIRTAGAYGEVMSSNYNQRFLKPTKYIV